MDFEFGLEQVEVGLGKDWSIYAQISHYEEPENERNAQEAPGVHLFPTVSVMMAREIEES